MYKVAIIGTGKIAGCFSEVNSLPPITHAQAVHKNPNCTLYSACDCNEERLLDFSATWKPVNTFSNIDDLIDHDEYDVVVITSPDDTHFEVLKKVFFNTQNKPFIILEKPLCSNKEELNEIENLAIDDYCSGMIINHTRRFNPLYREAREIITSSELGEFVSAQFIYYGGWIHNGVHVVDTLRYLFDTEFKIENATQAPHPQTPEKPCVNLRMRSKQNRNVVIEIVSHPEESFQVFELTLNFHNGRMKFENFCNDITIERVETNNIEERELGKRNLLRSEETTTPIENLYATAFNILEAKPVNFTDISFDSALRTMETLFDVQTN